MQLLPRQVNYFHILIKPTMTLNKQQINEQLFSSIGFLLGRTNHIKDRLLDQYLAQEEITSSQVKVLLILYFMGTQRSSDISKTLSVDGSAMTRMLDRLEKKQLIKRETDLEDRRSTLIQLTEEGRIVTDRAMPFIQTAIDHLVDCLSTQEQQNLQHCLSKIVSSFPSEKFVLSKYKGAKC
ncbi:MarR family winged helix-turn-helix transcriptional regulator [Marinomonas spartinae]|nr:MarR family transcriptional regulator [Marinomonas spartinae]